MGSAPTKGLLGRTFAVPAVLAVLGSAGLIFALVGDGVWDALSWLLLALPVAVAAWFMTPAARRRGIQAMFLRRGSEAPPYAS